MFINGKWRQTLHIEPPKGWLNDPNGLCFFGGFYHVYFQYAPEHADGSGKKCWGHYRSRDLLSWEFTGTVMVPDIPEDRDGVYSGSAVVCEEQLHLFYTGNVKHPGNYDYISEGREANVIHACTKDGMHMSRKEVVLRNEDYPAFCSCHVRDPKLWFENGRWNMVLGARTREDRGVVLFYQSDDLAAWQYVKMDSVDHFGYMWECPDVFLLGGHRYLSLSPQGLRHTDTAYQNVYSSGYFRYDDGMSDFREWDYGFDFYAPQTFAAPDGRRILIGWMGIGDIPYLNPTTVLGYQHCLTLPREITRAEDGQLLQQPVRELEALRKEPFSVPEGAARTLKLPFELRSPVEQAFRLTMEDAIELSWDGRRFTLQFTDADVGGGRTLRRAELPKCRDLRIIVDKSSLEIYLDSGRTVLSTRMYPKEESIRLTAEGIAPVICPLGDMEVKYLGE